MNFIQNFILYLFLEGMICGFIITFFSLASIFIIKEFFKNGNRRDY